MAFVLTGGLGFHTGCVMRHVYLQEEGMKKYLGNVKFTDFIWEEHRRPIHLTFSDSTWKQAEDFWNRNWESSVMTMPQEVSPKLRHLFEYVQVSVPMHNIFKCMNDLANLLCGYYTLVPLHFCGLYNKLSAFNMMIAGT